MSEIFREYITENYDMYLAYMKCFITNKNNAADVLNDILVYIVDKYGKRIDDIIQHENPSALIKRIIYIQSTSSASNAFHKKYKNNFNIIYNTNNTYVSDDENTYEVIEIEDDSEDYDYEIDAEYKKVIKLLKKYKNNGLYGEVRLFELYYFDGHTYRVIEDLTSIPYTVVFWTVRGIKEKLLNDINKII